MTPTAPVPLRDIASCFEGVIPSSICTVAPDGTPNVTFLSVVHYVDEQHVALSRQFFKKTDENTQRNPLAQLGVIEPDTGRQFLLDVIYERTETEGPLFERMRTKLDAVAAHEGMSNVFTLRGVDICRVLRCEMVPCDYPEGPPRRNVKLDRMEALSRHLATIDDMEDLFAATLSACNELFGYRHAFIMLLDETGERLYTVASTGYSASGAGSEVLLGSGLIGIAAARRQSVRVTQMARDLLYSHATNMSHPPEDMEQVIPLPVLPSIQSQIVTPMLAYRDLVGVLCFQSENPGAFQADDEYVIGILANQVAMALGALRSTQTVQHELPPQPGARPVQVKHYCADDSIFLDNEYLIKGVAGGILWKLLRAYRDEHRTEFTNKEIRLDQSLGLPDIKDNLEARLILLRKRLQERCDYLRIEKSARGRFRLLVTRPLTLVSIEGGGPL